ncbi:DNA/RNA non-specific endonuclease, partial [Spelaeicoccus albus]
HDLDVLLADYEAAQQECANKISAIYGGPKLTSFSNDSTSAKGHYAMTADQLDALSDQGKTPWGEPTDWDKPWYRDTIDAVGSFAKGVWDGAKGMATGLWDMVNFTDWKTFSATWKGIGTLGYDLAIVSSPGLAHLVGTKREKQATSDLTMVGKSIIHLDEWKTDPARAAGNSVFDVVTVIATIPLGGEGAAAKGVSAIGKAGDAMKGAGKLGRAGEVAGSTLKGVEKLADTLKVENLGKIFSSKGFKFGDGLGDMTKQFDGLDDLGKTVDDIPTGHVPGEGDLPDGNGLPDGGPTPHGDGVPDDAGVPNGDGVPDDAGVPDDHGPVDPDVRAGSPEYDGHSTPIDRGSTDYPSKTESFGDHPLEPNTRYDVEGRGTFYTNGDGRVTDVVAHSGVKGAWNDELNHPLPDVTYHIDDNITIKTDDHARTVFAKGEDIQLHPGDDNRSGHQQGIVGHRGGEGYEGGHLLASIFGGPGEKVNLVPQHMFQNRGAGPSNVPDVPREDLEVWHKVETDVRSELNAQGSDVKVDWEARPVYEGSNQVPSSIQLEVAVGHGPPAYYTFPN